MAIPFLESHALKSLPPYCSVRNLLFYFLYTCYVRSVLSRGYADISDSDVDPDWLYADPDPQNLRNADPDQGQ